MDTHLRSQFTARGLSVRRADGGVDEIDFFAGAMHYWRVPPEDWAACLGAIRELGLRVVDTYVPWSVHERRPGVFDWTGPRDLRRFLDAAAAAGLYVLLRPGPHINAELTLFGFPDHVLANPAVQARTARDTPMWLPAPPRMFPVPSYAAAAFQHATLGWYREVADQVRDRLAPDGPIAALQVDNEHQQFFRVGAFDGDYHPEALVWWRELAGEVEPPRAWNDDDPGLCAAWVGFKDVYAARALGWMTEGLREVGLGEIARLHNLPPTAPTRVDLRALSDAIDGPVGMDFYHRARDVEAYRLRARYVAGTAQPLPLAPELGVGGPPWLMPMRQADQASVLLGVLAAGIRGFNLYMAVDRERWYGAAISDTGSPRPPARWLKGLLGLLDEVGWTRLRRRARVRLVISRAEARFAVASSLADPLSPVLTDMVELSGQLARDDEAREHATWVDAVIEALELSKLPYAVIDERCELEELGELDVVLMPTGRRVDRAAWPRLCAAAERGVRVVIGPHRPRRDELDRPLDGPAPPRSLGRFNPGSLAHPAALADDIAALAGGAPEAWVAPSQPALSCDLFESDTEPKLLFTTNRSPEPLRASLLIPEGYWLEDPFSGAAVTEPELAGFEVKVFRISRGAG